MKHDIKFDHNSKTTESFGVGPERFNELKMFTTDYLPKICVGKPRSFVFEEILKYVDNVAEAMLVIGFVEHDRGSKNVKVQIIGGDLNSIPPEIRKEIMDDINSMKSLHKNSTDPQSN